MFVKVKELKDLLVKKTIEIVAKGRPNKSLWQSFFFFRESFNLWRPLLMIDLYHQIKTPISFQYRQRLNPSLWQSWLIYSNNKIILSMLCLSSNRTSWVKSSSRRISCQKKERKKKKIRSQFIIKSSNCLV